MDLELEGRSVLVTGSSKGLGFATARTFLNEGARVTLCARTESTLEEARSELEDFGEVQAVPTDVTDDASVDNLAGAIEDSFGGLDVLVNNVGSFGGGSVAESDIADWEGIFQTKLVGAVRVTQKVLPLMPDNDGGSIVNMSGLTCKMTFPNGVITGTINAGMTVFNKYLSEEVASRGIRVNAVCPGVVRTKGWEERGQAIADEQGITLEEFFQGFVEQNDISLGRWGRPEEIGDLVALLASPRMGYVTGETIISGGGLAKDVR